LYKPVITSRARRRLGLALDRQPVAARRDIDAEAVLDRDEVLVVLTEQGAEQLRLVELDLETGALVGARRGSAGLSGH